jgi:hypothetical protein
MERHSRRSALLHLAAVALLFLGYGLELLGKLLDLMPQEQAPRVVEAEGHAAGRATVRGVSTYTLAAETGRFT